MKITSVEVVLEWRPAFTPKFNWRFGLPGSEGSITASWLVIETDEGFRGFAPCTRGVILSDLVDRRLRAELLGVDPLKREWLWHRLWELDRIEEFPLYLIGVVDDALWDLAGKIAGLPVHELAGSFRDEIPAYASTVTFDTVDEYLDVADQCLELGFTAIKLHAWGDWRRDADLCVRLREHVGSDIPLMYDGSAGFDLLDSVNLGRVLSAADYLWYEEPMREFSQTAYRLLSERVEIPLLVGETSDGAHMNSADFIAAGTATAVRTGTTYRGGFTGALRTAHLADSFLMRAEVHGGGVANRQLCMTIPNTTYYESLIYSNPVTRPREVNACGMVSAPVGSGMGWEAEWSEMGWPPVLAKFVN